jgi:hypothetical protein
VAGLLRMRLKIELRRHHGVDRQFASAGFFNCMRNDDRMIAADSSIVSGEGV